MVVVVQPGVLQLLGLSVLQHAQRDAGFQAQRLDRADHLRHGFQVMRLGAAPGRAHAKALRTARLRGPGGGHHLVQRHQLVRIQSGVVMRGLRAVGAVFGTAARLDRQEAGQLDRVRVEVGAVYLLRAVHQVHERQRVERQDVGGAPGRGGQLLGRRRDGNGGDMQGGLLSVLREIAPLAEAGKGGSADRKNLRRVYATCVRSPKMRGTCRCNCRKCGI
ncbi:hypothetical protein D3C86_1105550 [compost metagenome]